jgi:hypothetical protein
MKKTLSGESPTGPDAPDPAGPWPEHPPTDPIPPLPKPPETPPSPMPPEPLPVPPGEPPLVPPIIISRSGCLPGAMERLGKKTVKTAVGLEKVKRPHIQVKSQEGV